MSQRLDFNSQERVVFFYPSKVLGGAELLFVRMALELQKRGVEVFVVDYADGVQAKRLDGSGVKLIVPRRGFRLRLPEDATLVTPLSSIQLAQARCEIPPQMRVLLWILHPMNVCALFRDYQKVIRIESGREEVLRTTQPKLFTAIRASLEMAHRLGGLWPMDEPNRQSIEKTLGFELQRKYLPIALEDSDLRADHAPSNPPRIAWLGRVSNDKIFAIIRVLQDAEQFSRQSGVTMTMDIIGQGESDAELDRIVSTLQHVKVERLGTLSGEKLENYLSQTPDIVFAMGTSLLEAARLAIPTVLSDPSLAPLGIGLPYRWVHQLENYSVGEVVSSENPPREGQSFADILRSVSCKEDWFREGLWCREYFLAHHDLRAVTDIFLETLGKNRLRTVELKAYGIFSWFIHKNASLGFIRIKNLMG